MLRGARVVLLVGVGTLVPALSAAQTTDDSHLAGARAASAAGEHLRAVGLARASASAGDPATVLFIAQELAAAGHAAEAIVEAEACARSAARNSSGPSALVQSCCALQGTLRGRVGEVIVRAPTENVGNLSVHLNGRAYAGLAEGVPTYVDAGSVRLVARTNAGVLEERLLDVRPGSRVEVRLGSNGSTEVQPLPALGRATLAENDPILTSSNSANPGGANPWPYLTMSLGAASFLSAGVFFGFRGAAIGDCNIESEVIACPSDAAARRAEAAYTWNILTDVAITTGTVGVLGGGLWWLMSRGPRNTPTRRTFLPANTPRLQADLYGLPGSMGVVGRF